ncbi:transport permease protein [Bryobacterales bacterium F-183]|nr:transport permease protein [Bryobacterales bacterium F-183]
MWKRIRVLVRKEFLQVLRNPRTRILLIVPPIMQLMIFGFAANLDIENARVAFFDRDNTPQSRALRAAFDASPYFEVTDDLDTEAQLQKVLDSGKVLAAIRILPGFARDLARNTEPAQVQVLVDGTNSNNASIVSGYANRLIAGFRQSGATPDLTQTRVWFNPELKSRYYFIPGVAMNILTIITMMLTALALVREREIGTMEQLMVSPLAPSELIIGKTLPFVAIGFLQFFLILTVAKLVFGVPVRGSIFLLILAVALYLLTTLGSGVLISTISKTQQQAVLSVFLYFMPVFMFSGFTFPVRNMPDAVRWIANINPQRYFIDILRGVFLKGSGIDVLWEPMAVLAGIGILVLGTSILRFHRQLD